MPHSSSIFIDDLIFDFAVAAANGDRNLGQTIVDNIQQGTVARISRVARLASRLTRTIKAVNALSRHLINYVTRKQNTSKGWAAIAKLCGVFDEAAKELEAAEKARDQTPHVDVKKAAKTGAVQAEAAAKAAPPATGAATAKGGGGRASVRSTVTSSTVRSVRDRKGEIAMLRQRKERAKARAAVRANETSPSAIGATVLEKMTSKLVLTILLLLLVYSIFYDLPQIGIKDGLYQQQLNSLVMIERAVGADSPAFTAALDATVGNGSALTAPYLQSLRTENAQNNAPFVVYAKIGGRAVFNMTAALNLTFSIVTYRRPSELVYTRDGCGSQLLGLDVAGATCDSVIVYDRRLELQVSAQRGGRSDAMSPRSAPQISAPDQRPNVTLTVADACDAPPDAPSRALTLRRAGRAARPDHRHGTDGVHHRDDHLHDGCRHAADDPLAHRSDRQAHQDAHRPAVAQEAQEGGREHCQPLAGVALRSLRARDVLWSQVGQPLPQYATPETA